MLHTGVTPARSCPSPALPCPFSFMPHLLPSLPPPPCSLTLRSCHPARGRRMSSHVSLISLTSQVMSLTWKKPHVSQALQICLCTSATSSSLGCPPAGLSSEEMSITGGISCFLCCGERVAEHPKDLRLRGPLLLLRKPWKVGGVACLGCRSTHPGGSEDSLSGKADLKESRRFVKQRLGGPSPRPLAAHNEGQRSDLPTVS